MGASAQTRSWGLYTYRFTFKKAEKMSGAEREMYPSSLMIGVLTISDSRAKAVEKGKDEDISGRIIEQNLKKAGHSSTRTVVPDDAKKIRGAMMKFTSDDKIDAIITCGGTGITPRDVTIEVIHPLLDKELPGFGEILRKKGYEMVGGAGLLTRTTAGVIGKKPVFCLPGTPNAVKVGMKIILPVLNQVVKHARG